MSQKHVEILRKARRRIASGKDTFICNVVSRSDKPECVDITHQIGLDLGRSVIGHTHTYETWLNECHGVEYWGNTIKLVNSRLAWIDALIEYWRDRP